MTAEEYQAATILRSLLTPVEIEALRNWRDTRRHPVARLNFPREGDLAVIANMGWALGRVMDVDPQWLLNQKARLAATDDYANVSAVLAEIRAYGFMLNAGLPISSGSKRSGPDFFIEEQGQRRVSVEVYSKQWDLGEVMASQEFKREGYRVKPGEGVTARVHLTTPFGGPTDRDNVTVNAIHKLTQIKQREHQFSATETSILWLDFQDESWDLLLSVIDTLPVISWHGELYSRPIWYAFYGWKGAPILEGQTTELRIKGGARACSTMADLFKEPNSMRSLFRFLGIR